MKNLIAFPLLIVALMIQMAVVSRISLLSGNADLLLLIVIGWALQPQAQHAWQWALLAGGLVAIVSGQAVLIAPLGYLLVALAAVFVRGLVWQMPVLALFTLTFFATLFMHLITFLSLWVTGLPILFGDTLAYITIPSLFLNILLMVPVYTLMKDIALWVFPLEEMV